MDLDDRHLRRSLSVAHCIAVARPGSRELEVTPWLLTSVLDLMRMRIASLHHVCSANTPASRSSSSHMQC